MGQYRPVTEEQPGTYTYHQTRTQDAPAQPPPNMQDGLGWHAGATQTQAFYGDDGDSDNGMDTNTASSLTDVPVELSEHNLPPDASREYI